MLAWWTELLPVFVFKRLAQKHCGVLRWEGIAWHDARPGVAVRNAADWWKFRVNRVAEHAQKNGIESTIIRYGHFGKKAVQAGIDQAFWKPPFTQEGS